MARRRYLSTTISTDKRVNALAIQYGDFAALLFTWLIPHAEDDATISSDPEEIMLAVMPGRRDKTVDHVVIALDGMVTLRLLQHDERGYRFPDSFYEYQTYIGDRAKRRKTPKNAEEQRTSAQNAVSFPVSSSFPVSFPVSVPVNAVAARRPKECDDQYVDSLVSEFSERLGGGQRTREIVAEALNHKAGDRAKDKRLYLRGWLRREAERYAPPRGQVSDPDKFARFRDLDYTPMTVVVTS